MRTNKPQILFCWWYQILLFLFRNFVCYNWKNKNTIFCRSKKFNQKLFWFWFCCQQSIPLLDCISKNTITTKNKTQKWELEIEHMAHFICVGTKGLVFDHQNMVKGEAMWGTNAWIISFQHFAWYMRSCDECEKRAMTMILTISENRNHQIWPRKGKYNVNHPLLGRLILIDSVDTDIIRSVCIYSGTNHISKKITG